MSEPERQRWRPTRTTLVAGGIVIAGFFLASVSWWFFLLVAVGALGPGILREIGWLEDKDEFQRRADHRAGYHAFLVVALVAFLLEAFFRTGGELEHPRRLVSFFLALLWFTWFVSSMVAYWGPQRASAWILRVFGSVVLVFTIVSNLGSEWTGWPALLLHPLLAAPFFVLAWLAGRMPRVSGVVLVGVSIFLFFFLAPPSQHLVERLASDVTVLLNGPLLASGVALLAARATHPDDDQA